jgi:hypothetical protein
LVIQVIGAIAEFERNLIAERTKAGLAVAKARGKQLGNPRLMAGDRAVRYALVAGQRRARLLRLLPGLDEWLPLVRQLRPVTSWEAVTRQVNKQLPTGRQPFTRDRLVRTVRLLVQEHMVEDGIVKTMASKGRRRNGATLRAVEAVARYLRSHRREAVERGISEEDYRPPTLVQIGRHLIEDAGLLPPSGGAWALSSLKSLRDHTRD